MGVIHCNLRVLMAQRGLNIKLINENTKLSRTTISNLYNNNGVGVQFDTMRQLCELLDVKVGDLFTYVDISAKFGVIQNSDEEEINIIDIIECEEGKIINTDIWFSTRLTSKIKHEEFFITSEFNCKIGLFIDDHKNLHSMDIYIDKSYLQPNEHAYRRFPTFEGAYYEELERFILDISLKHFYNNYIDDWDSKMNINYYTHYNPCLYVS